MSTAQSRWDRFARADGSFDFSFEAPIKGIWTHLSPQSTPPETVPELTNINMVGGMAQAQRGNKKFISTAWPNDGGNINLVRKSVV